MKNETPAFSAFQTMINERKISISWNPGIFKGKAIARASLIDGETDICSITEEQSAKNGGMFLFVSYFGEWTVTLSFESDEGYVFAGTVRVPVVTKEYHICIFKGSMPILLFFIKYYHGDIRGKTRGGQDIPFYLTLNRKGHIDTGKLPEGMYENPFAKNAEYNEKEEHYFINQRDKTFEYVKMLKSISPGATFVFYMNDTHVGEVLPYVYKMHLPARKQRLILISDGSNSFATFKAEYTDYEFAFKHYINYVLRNYIRVKREMIAEAEKIDFGDYSMNGLNTAIVTFDRNVKWWLIRPNDDYFLDIPDKLFTRWLFSHRNIEMSNIYKLMQDIRKSGNLADLYDIFRFDTNEENTLSKRGGFPLVLILSSSHILMKESEFIEFIRLTAAWYGKDYRYTLKEHPRGDTDPAFLDRIREMGIDIISGNVPSEFIAFDNSEMVICGYPSTTYVTMPDAGKIGGIYESGISLRHAEVDITYEVIHHITESAKLHAFCETAGEIRDEEKFDDGLKKLLDGAGDDEIKYMVFFNEDSRYDLGIWDADRDMLILYKRLDEGIYEKAGERRGIL